MAKYVLTYHGGMPSTPADAEASRAQWSAWFEELGSIVVDDGFAVKDTLTLGGRSVDRTDLPMTSGYSVVEASGLEEAKSIAGTCPILAAGGTVEVSRALRL